MATLNLVLDRPLALVSAPAGFGKTTAVSQWCHLRPQPVAWLSLDRADNDLVRFLRYFSAAIRTVYGSFGSSAANLLSTEPVSPDAVATSLCNDLLEISNEFIIVLDDYHFIQEPAIHRLVEQMIDYFPVRGRLLLISRSDPLLPLARWRGRGQIIELRMTDLRFSAAEIEAYLRQRHNLATLNTNLVNELEAQTEGWIASIQLLVPALPTEPASAAPHIQSNPYIWNYLSEEVLAQQPETVQHFLLQTSILERFCPALCDAVCDDDSHRSSLSNGGSNGKTNGTTDQQFNKQLTGGQSHGIMAAVRRDNLFLVPVDEEEGWYRYHPLFRSLLQQRLRAVMSRAEIIALHRRAGEWLARNGQIETALPHLLAAGRVEHAAALIEESVQSMLMAEEYSRLDHWLNLLPEAEIQRRPVLLLTRAWQQRHQFRLKATMSLLAQVSALLDDGAEHNPQREQQCRGRIDAMQSEICYWAGDFDQSAMLAERALETLPPGSVECRALAVSHLALSRQAQGDVSGALQRLNSFLASHARGNPFLETRILVAIQFVYYLSGNFALLDQVSERLLKVADKHRLPREIAWSHYFRGMVAYEKNALAAAEHHFQQVNQQQAALHVLPAMDSYLALALVYQAQKRTEPATQMLDAAAEFALEQRNLALQAKVESFRARLALQRNKEVQLDQPDWILWNTTSQAPHLFLETPALTKVRLSLARPTPAALRESAQGLQRWRQAAEASHNIRLLITVSALQALVDEAQGRRKQALARLEQSLALARPSGLIRTYVELGPALAQLLHELTRRKSATTFVRQILAAFDPLSATESGRPTQPESIQQRLVGPLSAKVGHLVEPLSDRELDVLCLLSNRFSNKEIAQQLIISPLTVKKHTSNIYQKLNVNNRRGAVRKAQELGLLVTD